MANRFKNNPISRQDIEDAQMFLDGTYWDDIPCADFCYENKELAEKRVDNMTVRYHCDAENEYRDKRIKGDTRQKMWIVNAINGDTETHYVQPIRASAVFSDKHSAMECIRGTEMKLALKFGHIETLERVDMADYIEIRLEIAGAEIILTAQAVIPNGWIDCEHL